jgi:methionyl-tRNA formyltransferase
MRLVRIVFAGTPEFALPSLEALHARADVDVVAVYTQPDKRKGRGRQMMATPVKRLALDLGLAIEQPPDLRARGACDTFAAYEPELLVVAAYGHILPAEYLDIPTAPINVHASVLPRWRGAAPIQRALMAGDRGTGISIMRIVERLDAGPVWLVKQCAILASDTAGTLHDRLAALGAQGLTEAFDLYLNNAIVEMAQDETLTTYADKISNTELAIDWSQPALTIERQIRALSPEPGARTELGGCKVKVYGCGVDGAGTKASPGTVLEASGKVIKVATGKGGVLTLLELQPAGKRRMSAASFINGYGGHL